MEPTLAGPTMDALPPEVLRIVLSHSDLRGLRRAAVVSKMLLHESRAVERQPSWKAAHWVDLLVCGSFTPRRLEVPSASCRYHTDGFEGLMDVSVGGGWLVAAGRQCIAHIWRSIDAWRPWRQTHSLAHPAEISCTAIQPSDGGHQLLATACRDGCLRVWTLETGELVHECDAHGSDGASRDIFALVWLSAHELLSGGSDRTLQRWSVDEPIRCLQRLDGTAAIAALSYDGDEASTSFGLVASPQRDHSIVLLAASTLEQQHACVTPNKDARPLLTVAIANGIVVGGGMGGCIRVWDAMTAKCTRTITYGASATYALVLLGGEILLTGGAGELCVRVWRLQDGECVARLHRPTGGCGSVCALAADGAHVVSGDNASCLPRLWEAGGAQRPGSHA
jgi:WD40 repeat protein